MNPKAAKMLAKLGVGVVGSALIGYTIKAEKAIEAKVEEHYDRENSDEEVSSLS